MKGFKIILIIAILISFILGWLISDLAFEKGVRPWSFVIGRVIQSEQDHHYLEQCLMRERISGTLD